MIKRIRQWLIDTYNGIYVIVLKPHMPSYATVAALVLAFLFGILWGYVVRPVVYYDGSPYQMSAAARDEWVKLVAGNYYANIYDDATTITLLQQVENPGAVVDRLIQAIASTSTDGQPTLVQVALQNVQPLAQAANPGRAAPQPGSLAADVLWIILPIILLVILAWIVSPVWRLLVKPNIYDTIYEAVRPKTQAQLEEKKQQQRNRELIREQKESEAQMRKDTAAAAATNPYGAPVMQKLSIYAKGRAYDDSFAIEDANDMFLGECGATIARTMGDTNQPTAVEVWLFDKEDFVRTLNKLLVTEHAYNDPMIRAELEGRVDNPATDIIVATPGATLTLETDALLFQAKVLELTYGDNGIQPPKSFFESLRLQVETWQKSGAVPAGMAGGMAAPVTPLPAASPVQPLPLPPAQPMPPAYNPPPMPAYSPPPAALPPQPPLPPRQPQDDDPFGGTGDFTPIG